MGGELHQVKHLYVDDDGNIIAETWSGVITFVVPMSSVGQPHGVASLNGSGRIPVDKITPFIPGALSLPQPGPDYMGKPIRVKLPSEKTPSGTKTEIYACVVNSKDQYEWVKLGKST